jgi:hypothetical protein
MAGILASLELAAMSLRHLPLLPTPPVRAAAVGARKSKKQLLV